MSVSWRLVLPIALALAPLGACSDSTTGSGSGSESGAEDEDLTPALGIEIVAVEANQGTGIYVAIGGDWIPSDERLGPLVADRDMLVRVHYRVSEGFVPRELDARLTLEREDGSIELYEDRKLVDGDSKANLLEGTFSFGLEAELGQVTPNTKFQVEIVEIDEGAAIAGAGLSESVWQTPPELETLGVQPEPMELKVVFVPFHYQYGNIDRITDTSDEMMKAITDELYELNPVAELTWEIHEPLLWDKPMENLGAVLGTTAALRDNELAFPNVYYHAIFPVPSGGVDGVAGIAQVPGGGLGEASERVSATAIGSDKDRAAHVVAHEIGHNQGQHHVFCAAAVAQNTDPNYPYEDGVIGQWGFGLRSLQLYSPSTYRDYMSYCDPSWVSTYSWNKTFTRIRRLTSWDYDLPQGEHSEENEGGEGLGTGTGLQVLADYDRPLLFGSIAPNSPEFWWVGHGTLPVGSDPYGDDYDHQIELRAGGELVEVLPAVVRYTNDFSTAWIIAELPEPYEDLEGIETIVRIDDHEEVYEFGADTVQLSRRPEGLGLADAVR